MKPNRVGMAIATAFMAAATACWGQIKQWDKRLGGSTQDTAESIHQTADGGYIVGGWSSSDVSGDKTQASRGNFDFWIVKMAAYGTKQWDKRFGGSEADYCQSVQQTADGGYILGGRSRSGVSGDKTEASRGGMDYWVVKVASNGVKQWDKRFGGSGDDYLQIARQTLDGGYILAGESPSGMGGDKTEAARGDNDYWIVKLNRNGKKQWDKTYGGSGSDRLNDARQTADGGYILAGYSYSGVSGDRTQGTRGLGDYWIVKVDSKGVKQWDKRFGGSERDYLHAIQQTKEGGYILGGHTETVAAEGDKTDASWGLEDTWIVKVNANGQKQWDKRFGGSGRDYCMSVQQTTDGGFILGGSSDSGANGDKSEASRGERDYWIVKVDANGVKQWDRTYGGTGWETLYGGIRQTADSGYIVCGESSSGLGGDKTEDSRGNSDYWIVKLAGQPPDAYEPDNNSLAAKKIRNGDSQWRSIHRVGNRDWAKFWTGSQGALNLVVETKGTIGNTEIGIYNSAGQRLFYDDNSGAGLFSRIYCSWLAAGTYYIRVQEKGNNGTIDLYQLKVRWQPAPQE